MSTESTKSQIRATMTLCDVCDKNFTNEVKIQKKMAAALNCSLHAKKMEAWRFRNCRPKLERCFLRCEACEAAKLEELTEFSFSVDAVRNIFLRRLHDNDTEVINYFKYYKDLMSQEEDITYKSVNYIADSCPNMIAEMRAATSIINIRNNSTFAHLVHDTMDELIELETAA